MLYRCTGCSNRGSLTCLVPVTRPGLRAVRLKKCGSCGLETGGMVVSSHLPSRGEA